AMVTRAFVSFVALAAIAGAGMQTSSAAGASPQTPARAASPPSTQATKAVIQQYCAACHNDRLRTGGVSFDGVDYGNLPAHADLMERAARKLLVGSMPPQGSPRPDAATL